MSASNRQLSGKAYEKFLATEHPELLAGFVATQRVRYSKPSFPPFIGTVSRLHTVSSDEAKNAGCSSQGFKLIEVTWDSNGLTTGIPLQTRVGKLCGYRMSELEVL